MDNDNVNKIISIANKILTKQTPLVEGAREMSEFEDSFARLDNIVYKDYEVFMDLKFDTNSLPITISDRKNWNSDALQLKDVKIKEIEEKYRDSILLACHSIIDKLSKK